MRLNYHHSEREELLAKGGFLLETVDCDVCGRVFVPHLITDRPGFKEFGLCDDHYIEYLQAQARKTPQPVPRPEGTT